MGFFCEKILLKENSKQTFIQIPDYDGIANFNFSENQTVHFSDKKITTLHYNLN